jgi:hypothetical protein
VHVLRCLLFPRWEEPESGCCLAVAELESTPKDDSLRCGMTGCPWHAGPSDGGGGGLWMGIGGSGNVSNASMSLTNVSAIGNTAGE